MQFITHRDPVNVPGSARAFGAAGDAINNLLGIYGDYKNKQLEQKRYEAEQARVQKEFELRKTEMDRQAQRQDLQDQLTARQLEEAAAARGIPGTRPTVKTGERTVDAAPDFNVDSMKPDAATPFGAAPDLKLGSEPLAGMLKDQFKLDLKQPTRTEDVMGPAPVERRTIAPVTIAGRQIAGYTHDVRYEDEIRAEQEAAQHRKSMDIEYGKLTPEQREMIQKLSPASSGLFEAQGWVPAGIVDNIMKIEQDAVTPKIPKAHITDPVTGQILGQDPKTGMFNIDLGRVGVKGETGEADSATLESHVQSLRNGQTTAVIPPKYRSRASNAAREEGVPVFESAKQKAGYETVTASIAEADRLKELLADPQVKDAFGWLAGRWSQSRTSGWASMLPGEVDPKVREAVSIAQNLNDLRLRQRSGAAISEKEAKRLGKFSFDPTVPTAQMLQNMDGFMIELGALKRGYSGLGLAVSPAAAGEKDPAIEARRRAILGESSDRTLGAPQSNALGLPRVRVDHTLPPRR